MQKTAYEMRISDSSSDVCSSDLGSVENDLDFKARRQRFRNLIELGGNILGHDTAVLVDEHEDGTNHRLLAVHAARARAQIIANPDVGDLADSDRNAAARCRNGVPNLVDGTRAGIDADEVGFAATVIKIGANSEVGFFQRLAELAVGNSEIGQLGRIGFDDDVFRVATERVDTRHARHRLQLRAADSVLHGSQTAGLLNLVGQPVPLTSEKTDRKRT